MVSMDKVQKGMTAFIDRELVPILTGWDKVLVGGGAGVLVAKLPKVMEMYPVISAFDIYDKESNQVDVDTLYNAVIPYVGADTLPLKIPYLGITVKVGRQQIDELYKYIKEA